MEISFLFEEFDVGEITGFELGDIIIEKGDFQVSSTDRNPNQSMMLFITIPVLMDSVRKMIEDKQQETEIEGVDSSYVLKVKRKRNAYYISDDKHLIGGIEQRELLNGVYIAAERVWNQYGRYIQSDSVREDFRDALERYRSVDKGI